VNLQIVASGSTLAASPAFQGAVDNVHSEHGDWVAKYQSYTDALAQRVTTGLADVLGKYTASVSGIKDHTALQVFKSLYQISLPY